MAEYFKPLGQVELDVLLYGRTDEAATPAASLTVRYWPTDATARVKEKETDVRINLKS